MYPPPPPLAVAVNVPGDTPLHTGEVPPLMVADRVPSTVTVKVFTEAEHLLLFVTVQVKTTVPAVAPLLVKVTLGLLEVVLEKLALAVPVVEAILQV